MTQRHGGIVGKDYDAAKQTTTTFTSNGIFTPHTTQDVSFLCVGGGGAGSGADAGSGGGGAGGYRSSFNGTDTKLLIHSDALDGSTIFTDSAGERTITVAGNTHHETDQKNFGPTSIYFDGTGDYLSIPDSDDWNFGSGDMTYEFWLRPSSLSGIQVLLGQFQSSTENMAFYLNADELVFEDKTSNSWSGRQVATTSANLPLNTWSHIAVVKNGTNAKIYVDGIQEATNSFGTGTDFSAAIEIGGQDSGSAYMYTGYMDEIRITKTARYTGNFTVPDGPEETPLALTKGTDYQITVGDGGIGGDETHYHYGRSPQRELSETSRGFGMGHDSAIGPYADIYTKLMIQSYHAENSTTFTDLSDSAHTITVNGHTEHRIGYHTDFHPSAIYFDGTGDYLQLPTSSDWAFGTGDFTVECWFRQDSSPSYNAEIFDTRISGRDETTGFAIGIRNNGSFYIYCNGDKPVSTGGLISANTWYHLAVVRQSGNIILFLDGDHKGNYSSATQTFTNTQLKIGRRGDTDANPFKGYLDDIRVSKGVARYTSTSSGSDNTIYDSVNRIISYGGGRAGSQASGRGSWSGASGGGGTYTSAGAPVSIPLQGHAGGLAVHFGGSGYGGGGGGGAGAVGGPSSGSSSGGAGDVGGDGGAGRVARVPTDLVVPYSADNYTKLLIHSNTSDGSTTFTDSSDSSHSFTVNGNTHHETDQMKYGATSIYFDGTGDNLALPTSSDWAFGTADFNIDTWIRQDSSPETYEVIFDTRGSVNDTAGMIFGIKSDGKIYIYSNGYMPTSAAGVISANTWHHIVLLRDSGTHEIFVDGISVATSTTSRDFTSTAACIAATPYDSTEYFQGYMDEFRISKGIARPTQTFGNVFAGGGGGGHRLAMTNAAEPGPGGAGGGGAGQGGGTHGTNGAGGTQGDGVDGLANTGGGGGGSGGQNQSQYGRISDTGGDGGSGIVIMYEPAANSGVWNMDDVFRYVSDGKW